MTRPRADAVIRRFLGGADIIDLRVWLLEQGVPWEETLDFIEQCIRRRLNAARKRKR